MTLAEAAAVAALPSFLGRLQDLKKEHATEHVKAACSQAKWCGELLAKEFTNASAKADTPATKGHLKSKK